MPSLAFNEPHPSVAPNAYTHSGRGGFGNTFRATPEAVVASAPRPVKVPRQATRFYSGIGGAGNAHAASERKVMDFSEEFQRAQVRDQLPASHTGIGGAGNVYRRKSNSSESDSESTQRLSAESGSFWGRLSIGSLNRH
jgi:hypothetical protein